MTNFHKICIVLIIFISAMPATSCKKYVSSKAELMEYINNPANGLIQDKKIKNINTAMVYMPQEVFAPKKNSQHSYIRSDKLYFQFRLSMHEKELLKQIPFNLYSEIVQIISFRMGQYVRLVTEKGGAIVPDACLFQQTYGLGKENILLVIFNKGQIMNEDCFSVHIDEFGLEMGNIDYRFNTKDIKKIPAIK